MTSRYDYMRQASLFTMNGLPDPMFETADTVTVRENKNTGRLPFLMRALYFFRGFREKKEAIQSR